jgi:Holliday junction resolvasome RuvABC endonuclease subunit
MLLKIGGIDPSLRNTGFAKAEFNTHTGDWQVIKVGLVETEKQSGKSIRVNSDDLRCGSEIVRAMHDWIADCHVVVAEIPSGGQSAAAAKGLGLATGILSTIGCVGVFKGSLIQVMPAEVKLAAIGAKNASKDEMIEWAQKRWPDVEWKMTKRGGVMVPTLKNEHIADACGAIAAGIKTDQFRTLIAALSILTQ